MTPRDEVRFERIPTPEVPWDELARRPDRSVTQTLEWLDFLVETQGIEPVICRVIRAGRPVGWFSGGIVRRGGLPMLGSPLRGWTTPPMGCTLDDTVAPAEVAAALPDLAFGHLRCVHLEVADRAITHRRGLPPRFHHTVLPSFKLGIDVDDATLLAGMRPGGRRDVRRGLRNGITVEEVDPSVDPGFATEYHAQVCEAFAKHGQVPPYPVARVEALIRHLHPTGRLLLLRARAPDGEAAASAILPGMPGGSAELWMTASNRRHQHLLPNEVLMWHALRAWRDRGARTMGFGGGGRYKAKYGGHPTATVWLRVSRPAVLEHARRAALALHRRRHAT